MEKYKRCFLTLLNGALHNVPVQMDEELSQEDWLNITSLAREHNVLPMVYEAMYPLPGVREFPFVATAKHQVMQQVMFQTMRTNEFLALNRHLRSAGIKPLVVKGIICRDLYPMPDHRQSGDEDILVSPEQFDACHGAMLSFGMQLSDPETDVASAYEVPYGKVGSPIYIELHKHLFPPESEAYGDLNRFFEGVFDRAAEETIQGEQILTMEPTDHLFYLICHSFKHFLHSGFGIRQVCDIVLFAGRYGDRIDWPQVLENCRQIRADQFAAAMFRIGERYLSFDPQAAHYPACWQQIQVDEGPMLDDLLQSGIFGAAEMSRKHSSTITLTAVADQKQGRKNRSGILQSLFPSAKKLESRYPYLKQHPYLLPIAWGSRIVKYGKETKHAQNNNAADAVKIGNQRLELLKQYGILDQ